MSLSCSCDTDGSDAAWMYITPDGYRTLKTTRRKRCASCGTLIELGALCTEFQRTRPTKNFVEEKIYGYDGEIDIASMFHCENCADLYFNLDALGFECIAPDENMPELLKEYVDVYVKKENKS